MLFSLMLLVLLIREHGQPDKRSCPIKRIFFGFCDQLLGHMGGLMQLPLPEGGFCQLECASTRAEGVPSVFEERSRLESRLPGSVDLACKPFLYPYDEHPA